MLIVILNIEFLEWHKLKGNGKVNKVEIKIIQLQIVKRTIECERDMLLLVIGIPQLGGDPEFVPRANVLCNSPLDAVADRDFIAIVTRRIKMSVASP